MSKGKRKISEKTSEGHLGVLHACVFVLCTYDVYTVAAAAHKRVVVQTHPLSQRTEPSWSREIKEETEREERRRKKIRG